MHSITAYGARSTPVGAHLSADDCTQAFLDAIAAAAGTANSSDARAGIVYVPPCPPGYEYYVEGKIQKNFPMPHVEVARCVKILGTGTGDSLQGGSRIKLGPLCTGFRLVGSTGSSDGGEGAAAWIEGLSIFCTPLDETDIARGWESNTAYAKGDLIRPHRFHNFYYECLNGDGASRGPTPAIGDCTRYATNAIPEAGNRWMPGREYDDGAPGDIIYPNVACGWLFECVDGGRTIGELFSGGTPQDGEPIAEMIPADEQQGNVGEPAWFETYERPRTSIRSFGGPIIENAPQVAAPGRGPKWQHVVLASGAITGAANDPIEITSAAHGLADGTLVVIRGVGGNAAANGAFKVANAAANTFELTDLFGKDVDSSGAYVGGGEWFVPSDPEPLWELDNPGNLCLATEHEPSEAYTYGCHVFAPIAAGPPVQFRYDLVFIGIPDGGVGTTGTTGAVPPYAAFAAAAEGDAGIDDGTMTWYPIAPVGVVPDGDKFWAARTASAFVVQVGNCTIARCYVEGAPNAAIGVYSLDWTSSDETYVQKLYPDFTRVRGPAFMKQNGVGIYLRGGDTNGGAFTDLQIVGEIPVDHWLDPADHGIYDTSFGGSRYINCIVQACSGYSFAMLGGAAGGTILNSYVEGIGRKSPLLGNTQVFGGTLPAHFFRLNEVDVNSDGGGGPSFFNDQTGNVRTISHSDRSPGIAIHAELKGDVDSVFHFKAVNEIDDDGNTDADEDGYQLTYDIQNPSMGPGWWSLVHRTAGIDALHLSGGSASDGSGLLWLQRGHLLGQAGGPKHYHFSDELSSQDSFITGLVRRAGDVVDRADRAALGHYYHRVNVNPNGGKYCVPWAVGGHAYPMGTIRVPTPANVTRDRRAFVVTDIGNPPHESDPAVEPTWPNTLAATVLDGDLTWTCIEGADFRYASLIEDGAVGYRIQPVTVWADSGDTDERYVQPGVRVRSRRTQARTTTGTPSQVIDDGLALGADTEDFTLPDNATTVVDVLLLVKEDGNTEGGSVRLSGTYYREAAGAPQLVGANGYDAKLTAGIDPAPGAIAALVIGAGNTIEVQVSPAAAATLDWRLVRTQTEGISP